MDAPESWDRDADGRTDVLLKKAKEALVYVVLEFKLLGKEGGAGKEGGRDQNKQSRQFHGINTKSLYKLL